MPDNLRRPQHWRDILNGDDDSNNDTFEILMSLESAAEDIATSEVAMNGVFSYDEDS